MFRIHRIQSGLCGALLALLAAAAALAQPAEAPAEPIRPGDRIGVAISFAPTSPVATQPIRPGDRLAFSFFVAPPGSDGPYRLQPGDRVSVQMIYGSERIRPAFIGPGEKDDYYLSPLNRPYTIQPDGTLRLVGLREPVAAAGRTLDELTSEVERLYLSEGVLSIPEATINIEEIADLQHRALIQALAARADTEAPRLALVVPPDGRIQLPMLGAVDVAGLTTDDLATSLTQSYHHRHLDRLSVQVWFDGWTDQTHEQLASLLAATSPIFRLRVPASGRIALPLMPSQPIAGLDVDEAASRLTAYYREQRGLQRVEVSVWMDDDGE